MTKQPARKRSTVLAIRTRPVIKAFVQDQAKANSISVREYVEEVLIRNTAYTRFKKQWRDTHAKPDQTRNDHDDGDASS
jgi:hypothetical protein